MFIKHFRTDCANCKFIVKQSKVVAFPEQKFTIQNIFVGINLRFESYYIYVYTDSKIPRQMVTLYQTMNSYIIGWLLDESGKKNLKL